MNPMTIPVPTVPESGLGVMPQDTTDFGGSIWSILQKALAEVNPEITRWAGICLSVVAVVMLISLLKHLPGDRISVMEFAGVLAVAALLLQHTHSMVDIAANTVVELSEYGKLLLPVMTAAMASQGGVTGSAALYTGTAVFHTLLSSAIANLLIPLVYIFLAIAVAAAATGEEFLGKIRNAVKWLMTWGLKIILYVFTGYMSITGVVTGTADEAAVKATKLTMSGMIPVVGGILSDASEAVIIGAGMMKNAAGVYGMLALLAVWITPFLQIGISYLTVKLSAVVCDSFGVKRVSGLLKNISEAMGLLLGMTAAICILLLISVICFMKGMK